MSEKTKSKSLFEAVHSGTRTPGNNIVLQTKRDIPMSNPEIAHSGRISRTETLATTCQDKETRADLPMTSRASSLAARTQDLICFSNFALPDCNPATGHDSSEMQSPS